MTIGKADAKKVLTDLVSTRTAESSPACIVGMPSWSVEETSELTPTTGRTASRCAGRLSAKTAVVAKTAKANVSKIFRFTQTPSDPANYRKPYVGDLSQISISGTIRGF
jgi:hypothetical protein